MLDMHAKRPNEGHLVVCNAHCNTEVLCKLLLQYCTCILSSHELQTHQLHAKGPNEGHLAMLCKRTPCT